MFATFTIVGAYEPLLSLRKLGSGKISIVHEMFLKLKKAPPTHKILRFPLLSLNIT